MSPAALLLAAVPAAPAPDVSVPPGFVITRVADNPLAPDIYTMTIDDAGRVLVAGPGYVRVLVDENGDGAADRAIDLIGGLKQGPMGLLAEGDSLFVVTDGGLRRYRGYDGKSKLKGPPETIVRLKTGGEHDAHAVRRGPDGWLYLLCGNMAGVTKQTISGPRSPVKDPVAGTLLRISPDPAIKWEFLHPPPVVEVVADGFRNPYSFDFNRDGEPFTYDSDNERCVGLPWYEPCRFYHVVPGGNYGWRSPQLGQFWRKPPYFVDCVPPVCYLGRGSPTGVACYRHTHFPERYRGGFFLADWTFGRIHFVPLAPKHSTYEGKPEVFAEAVGTSGFAPTGLAVHPKTGELFVSIGGRGTRGGVYRISHAKSPPGKPLQMAKRSLEWTAADEKRWLAEAGTRWWFDLNPAATDRARRQSLESMLRWHDKLNWTPSFKDAVRPNLAHPDRLIRAAAGRTVRPLVVPVGVSLSTQARLTLALAQVNDEPGEALATALAVVGDKDEPEALKLQAIRIVQLALGDLTDPKFVGTAFEGYSFRKPWDQETADWILETLKPPSPADPREMRRQSLPDLDRERARVAAGLRGGDRKNNLVVPFWIGEYLLKAGKGNDPRDDIHFLACLGRLSTFANNDQDGIITQSLLTLEERRRKHNLPADTFWPLRIDELAAALIPGHHYLTGTLLRHPAFGRPEHAPLVKYLDPRERERAVRLFLRAAEQGKDYHWTPGVVALLDRLPDAEARPHLVKLWDRPELRDAILRVLPPEDRDQPKFVVGLASLDPEVVRLSASALENLPAPEGPTELASAVKVLRRLAPEDKAARVAVVSLLRKRSGEKIDADPKAWAEWVAKNHPGAAKLLAAADGFDAAAWRKREAGIPWDKGDAARGREVFTKATCAACHDGSRALGPSLLGVGKRFGRDDLITAVVQPNRDVPARYRATRVTTTDDKVYVGVLVYEAQDGIILQTGIDTAVRVAGGDIASKRPVEASLMPAGLLDKLTDAEVADLFAYLKSLDAPP